MTIARLRQSMWRWLFGLALICGVMNPAKANFVNNSCMAKVNGLPWNYTEILANPPEGLVVARRVVILDVTYQKTGNVMDELMIGGYWHAFGRFNSIYNTTSISGLPGVGIRFASLRSPQKVFLGTTGDGQCDQHRP